MRGFWEIVKLEILGLVRSWTVACLTCVSIGWMFLASHIFHSDGTVEGARELSIRYSLGGVVVMLAIVFLMTAAGSLSRERAMKRLQLTMVRPISLFALSLAKIVALSFVGASILACAVSVEALRQQSSRLCHHVYRPILPSPADEAAKMYEAYMRHPDTPLAVKKAKKSVVLRLLTQKAIDHYQTIGTNAQVRWRFPASALSESVPLSMRFRFTNVYNARDEVRGVIEACGAQAIVSNITQAVVTAPLTARAASQASAALEPDEVCFSNWGVRPLMLRPRRDIELLAEADGFISNLFRAYLQLVGLLTLLIAFGVFLGAGLSRPVAVFVAVVTLALCEMSPSVVEQYPYELEMSRADWVGLSLARLSAATTHPVSSMHPLSSLAVDDCIEWRDVVRTLAADVLAFPILFSILSAFVLPRKQDEL